MPRPLVFVSYTLRDGWLTVDDIRALNSYLNGFCEPYIHLLHGSWSGGQSAVLRRLARSACLLAWVTPGYLKSPWVQLELEEAVRRRIPTVSWSSGLALRRQLGAQR